MRTCRTLLTLSPLLLVLACGGAAGGGADTADPVPAVDLPTAVDVPTAEDVPTAVDVPATADVPTAVDPGVTDDPDVAVDVAPDAAPDAAVDAAPDAAVDAAIDVAVDTGDTGDTDVDLLADAASDATADPGYELAADTDAPIDIGVPSVPVTLELVTPSPGISLTPIVRGTVPKGVPGVNLFKGGTCDDAKSFFVSAADFAAGVPVSVAADQTTLLTARAADVESAPCTPPVLYVHHANAWQRLDFADEFKGPGPGDDPECFSIPPQCVAQYLGGLTECPADEVHAGLTALDKCKWTILRQPNWMSDDIGPAANKLNALMPQEVAVLPDVEDGVLVLSARSYHWEGDLLPGPDTPPGKVLVKTFEQPQATWLENYDCKWNSNTVNCPILSGAVYSRPFDSYASGGTSHPKARGYSREHGRFEVRAKLPHGPGSFPAHWLLPRNGSWPERGEMDIMESGRNAEIATQTFHTGYCDGPLVTDPYPDTHQECNAQKAEGAQRLHLSRGSQVREKTAGEFTDAWHVYTVDWTPDSLRFSIDGVLSLDLRAGDPAYGKLTDYGSRAALRARPIEIPHGEFYVILNQTIHNDSGGEVNPLGFLPQAHTIDWVHVYRECETPEDFCPIPGTVFDGRDGLCHWPATGGGPGKTAASPCARRPIPAAATSPVNSAFDPCTDPCPWGTTWFDGCNCTVGSVPPRHPDAGPCDDCGLAFTYGQSLYWTYGIPDAASDPARACLERLTWRDGTPEDVPMGQFDGAHCRLDAMMPDQDYFVWPPPPTGNVLYYPGACHFAGTCGN